MGGLGLVSQIAPIDEATSSLVVLLGLAVGVDYSLFYIRREREERRGIALPAAASLLGDRGIKGQVGRPSYLRASPSTAA